MSWRFVMVVGYAVFLAGLLIIAAIAVVRGKRR